MAPVCFLPSAHGQWRNDLGAVPPVACPMRHAGFRPAETIRRTLRIAAFVPGVADQDQQRQILRVENSAASRQRSQRLPGGGEARIAPTSTSASIRHRLQMAQPQLPAKRRRSKSGIQYLVSPARADRYIAGER